MPSRFVSANATFGGQSYELTEVQFREYDRKRKEDNAFWRDFWIGVMKDNGLSNAEIARRAGISETTVRNRLKKIRP